MTTEQPPVQTSDDGKARSYTVTDTGILAATVYYRTGWRAKLYYGPDETDTVLCKTLETADSVAFQHAWGFVG